MGFGFGKRSKSELGAATEPAVSSEALAASPADPATDVKEVKSDPPTDAAANGEHHEPRSKKVASRLYRAVLVNRLAGRTAYNSVRHPSLTAEAAGVTQSDPTATRIKRQSSSWITIGAVQVSQS